MKTAITAVVSSQEPYERTAGNLGSLDEALDSLYQDYQRVVARLNAKGVPASVIASAYTQLVRIERMKSDSAKLLRDGRDADKTAAELGSLAREFADRNKSLAAGAFAGDAELTA